MRLFENIRTKLLGRRPREHRSLAALFGQFQHVLELNNRTLTAIASMHSKLGGGYIFDLQYLRTSKQYLVETVRELLDTFDSMAPGKYSELSNSFRTIRAKLDGELSRHPVLPDVMAIPFDQISPKDMDAVGAKSTRLGTIVSQGLATVPDGFGITTTAYRLFMEHNDLKDIIRANEEAWTSGTISTNEASGGIRSCILAGSIPPRLRKSLSRELDALQRKLGEKELRLAVRSSAWGEDGNLSFAGQYDSFLNVTPDDLLDAYKKVLASTYSPSAMEYRRGYGFRPGEILMAVTVHCMVTARSSGVAYSLSPVNPGQNCIDVAATWGLGIPVVSGETEVDRFAVSRDPGHAILTEHVARKDSTMIAKPGGSVTSEPLPEERQNISSLSHEEVRQVAETAFYLERHFRKPQDMEFAFDEDGNLIVLQTRPLRITVPEDGQPPNLSEALTKYPVLLSGEGEVAQQGIGSGPVFVAWEGRDLTEFPDGAVLVARVSSPQYAAVLHRASGVITDIGSPLGHMATIAREHRVPTLLNASRATMVLEEGAIVTLDAEQKTVYGGEVGELRLHDYMGERIEETFEYRLLRRMLRVIEPLNLIDPDAGNFTPQGCQTLHDITRFVHEKAVDILANIPNASASGEACPGGRLALSVPMDLVVLDIGGGLTPECSGGLHGLKVRQTILPDQVESASLRAFIDGVTLEGVWQSTPVSVDFSSFMSSMTRTFSTDSASTSRVGQNLAVISDHYLHLSLRLGYHFTMIDCYESEDETRNSVQFRFAGVSPEPPDGRAGPGSCTRCSRTSIFP